MFRRRRSEYRRSRNIQRRSLFDFMRKPAFQIGFLIFALLIVITLALNGQKTSTLATPPAVNSTAATRQSQPTATVMPNVISVGQAYDFYTSNSAYFLDVRERSEWDEIHIPSTTLLPLNQVAALVDKFPKDKPIIMISASDNRSQQGRDILKQAGFTNVTSMAGGIVYWQSQGYPVEP